MEETSLPIPESTPTHVPAQPAVEPSITLDSSDASLMKQLGTDVERVARLIEDIERNLRTVKQLVMAGRPAHAGEPQYFHPSMGSEDAIDGIFDGERMVATDGQTYQVSPNYASKSKLVEGDPLKLYITNDGRFFYKQLGPVTRTYIPGVIRAEGGHYVADADNGLTYNVLTAAVTYYMATFGVQIGEKVMLAIPADTPSSWAAIENAL